MGDVVSITTLAGEFSSQQELQTYCNKQYQALGEAANRIKQLEQEIEHVKHLLITQSALVTFTDITLEEKICLAQIAILESRCAGKELTLEEIKKFDLLVKNLQIIRENNPKTLDVTPTKSELTPKELTNLAAQNIEGESTDE